MCDPIFAILGVLFGLGVSVAWAEPVGTTVGFPVRVQVVAAGAELEVVPVTERTCPVVVRIVDTSDAPAGRSYDLEAQGLEPGAYDLRNFLRRRDGSSMDGVPAIPITVGSVLAADRFEPAELAPGPMPGIGGYRVVLAAGSALWLLGLGVIWVTRPRKPGSAVAGATSSTTVAEELKGLISRMGEEANPAHLADIERAVIAYWTRRLGLGSSRPADALRVLGQDAEAGPMLALLEERLHRPAVPGTSADWLSPLRDLPPESVPVPSASREERSR